MSPGPSPLALKSLARRRRALRVRRALLLFATQRASGARETPRRSLRLQGAARGIRQVKPVGCPSGLDGQPRDAEIPRLPIISEAERAVDGDHRGATRV